MSATPESKVKDRVKAVLKEFEAYYHMPVQNGMGAPTLDFVGCFKGRYFAIETKALGKKPTPRQRMTMDKIVSAQGWVFVIDGELGLRALREWLAAVDVAEKLNPTEPLDAFGRLRIGEVGGLDEFETIEPHQWDHLK